MADIVITVPIATVFKEVARRTSIATETDPFYKEGTTEQKQYSQLHGEGDRITSDFTKEAAKEVLKAYVSRQGDVTGAGFEYDLADSGNIIYRFSENTVPLAANQTAAITDRLQDNTEDALIYYVMVSLYRTDGNQAKQKEYLFKALNLIDELSGDLYRLHD
jgi:hypothetical protein